MSNMVVAKVKSVSGKPLYEVQHVDGYGLGINQTLSEPFINRKDAVEYMNHLEAVKGTDKDPLAHYWARVSE